MDTPFFAYRPFDDEIGRKLAAVATPAEEVARPLLERRPSLVPLWAQLARLPFDDVYPNYLNHPVRVAGSLLTVRGDVADDELALALCHNIRETGLAERVDLPPGVAAAVDVLTIDRARERDGGYLAAYYDRIEAEGLIVLKALDKLDNALEWVRFDVDEHDVWVVVDHVCPRVEREDSRLAAYLAELVQHVVGGRAKARYAEIP